MKKRKGVHAIVTVVCLLLLMLWGATGAVAGDILKKIVIAVTTEPDTLDINGTKMDGVVVPIMENITERLIGLTPEGKYVPELATSWKVSADGKEIAYQLRKGVKFHNGDTFTAKDVLFSHERGLKSSSTYQRTMRYCEGLTIVDDYQVRFKFKSPDAQVLPGRGTAIQSKGYFDKVGEDRFVKEPVGTGPYRFAKWEPGQYVEMKLNDAYWGRKSIIKEARFVFVKEDTMRVAMLKTGEADMIMECPFPMVKDTEAAGFRTARVSAHPGVSIQFHNYNPKVPWYDKRVRLAIAMAVDSKAIATNLFQGIPTHPVRLNTWELGYDPALKPYPYDPQQAKKLLAEAGYPNGFEMPLYYFVGRASGQKETAEAVALYLGAIGVKAKVEGIEAIRMIERTREWHKSSDAVYVGVSTVPTANYPDPTQALEIGFYSESPISLYKNPAFDAALEKARSTLDEKKRAELIKQAVRILHEDVASSLIWTNVSVYAMQKNVSFSPIMKGSQHPMVMLRDIKPAG
jgi:peptide/nickel transport system substrate-binding protein